MSQLKIEQSTKTKTNMEVKFFVKSHPDKKKYMYGTLTKKNL